MFSLLAPRVDVSSHYICSLDVLPRSGTLLAAAVPVQQTAPVDGSAPPAPCVLGFTPPAAAPGAVRQGPWAPRGSVVGRDRGIMSFVRTLGATAADPAAGDMFFVAENGANSKVARSEGPGMRVAP